ncbi:permease [Fulvitalea axinellae]|uniref:Permease n=1 Tax=Fulvitalea axinellae TaxID=1182444 RepID=A0AAU9C8Y8_9BACT|nr:permease [Fulvitalea axinellae]
MLKDYLKLHFLVFIWGFTAILGVLITIPAVETVFYRTLVASLALGAWTYWKRGSELAVGRKMALKLLGTGALIGVHWMLFFSAAEVANASITLAGAATCAFWTSILDPLTNKRKILWYEVAMGLAVVLGLYVIFLFEFDHALGLALAIGAALLAAVFTVINGRLSNHYHHGVITFYELAGAWLVVTLFLPFYKEYFAEGQALRMSPEGMDWVYLAVLALICTVYAYAESVELMKRITPFAMNLTVNMEPVYGMVLAIFILGENKELNPGFYIGTGIILLSVLAYPFIKRFHKRKTIHKAVTQEV